MTTQISFLGKGKLNKQTGYSLANYCFSNGFKSDNPFFGLSLMECIKPQKLILLGTAGSMWDVFFDVLQTDDEAVLELSEAVATEQVTPDMLRIHQERLREKFGIPVQCIIIPYARSQDEQAQILTSLAEAVSEGEHVTLDVTHGFRHLPMLALVAARYLTHVRGVHIDNVYYGALEMTNQDTKETPVLELGGMLEMLDWVEALAVYKHSGHYGVFANLYKKDGMPEDRTKMLARAAYFERNNNAAQASQNLSGAFEHINSHQGPLGKLFSPILKKNINWFSLPRADWESALSERYLHCQDYLRSTLYMFEGQISRAVLDQFSRSVIDDHTHRDLAFEAIKDEDKLKPLKYLRNAMAHGDSPRNNTVQRLLQDEKKLNQELSRLRKTLFKNTPKQP